MWCVFATGGIIGSCLYQEGHEEAVNGHCYEHRLEDYLSTQYKEMNRNDSIFNKVRLPNIQYDIE